MSLPQWPPEASAEQIQACLDTAIDWSLSNGLILRPNPPDAVSAIHGPFSLLPTPFPKHLFHKVTALQKAYNALYAALASDEDFLDRVIGQTVALVDDFQGRLWKIWKTVQGEGIRQEITLGLFRSDYLLHAVDDHEISIKQVEFNTISSSFGPLSNKVTALHQHLLTADLYPTLPQGSSPPNTALVSLTDGLAKAHAAYGSKSAVILMVVQEPERNAFDQRAMEWELQKRHQIRLLRCSFSHIASRVKLNTSNHQIYIDSDSTEISVVYFRAGYTPRDYPTKKEWDSRLLLERSRAIKCPSIALQLAGAKKVQQVLFTDTSLLQQYLPVEYSDQIEPLRQTFMGMWPMDSTEAGLLGQQLALAEPHRFVLKPQREGGGNNIYKMKIPAALSLMDEQDQRKALTQSKEREGYILMELIKPPRALENILVRAGEGVGKRCEVVSELGIYGVALIKRHPIKRQAELLFNLEAGHLLRTKGSDDDEGGVAVGFSVIDSPWLV